MKIKHKYIEPLSTLLGRHPAEGKPEIADTVRWVGYSSLGIFISLVIFDLFEEDYISALVTSLGFIPILLSLILLKKDAVSIPSTILAVTLILLITWLATHNQGLYDIGILGYPVILIIAGLILRGRVIMYLAFLIILCLGWLAFGELRSWYEPVFLTRTNPEDFFIAGIIILIAGNAVYRLARNVYYNLARANQEIKMRREAEKEREDVIQQLKRKNQELDRFAIRVSHDLKTPLITLAGFLGYLENDLKAGNYARANKDFVQINEAAKTMGKFVDELLDLSRAGRIITPPTDVPFDEIVQESLKATDGLLKAKQVQVEVDSVFPIVHADRDRIIQVMQNLIVNAAKFMGEQSYPRIKILAEEVDNEHIFSISDNGIGIAPEHQEQIFELFNKLNPDTDGTGIGLGLVKRIIEVHNGRIWVVSEPGKGSTFKFTLQSPTRING